MQFVHLGPVAEGPTLELDHEEFAYAGKFVTGRTGKTVARTDAGRILGALSYNEDRGTPNGTRIRYVTVRNSRRDEGIGSRLLRFSGDLLAGERSRVAIGVNNPIAYEACYRGGFVFAGKETGIAEVLMEYDPVASREIEEYAAGLSAFRNRELPAPQREVLDRNIETTPPPVVEVPSNAGASDGE